MPNKCVRRDFLNGQKRGKTMKVKKKKKINYEMGLVSGDSG